MKIFFAVTVLLSPVLVALPPPVPSAGIIERELEKEYEAGFPGVEQDSIQE